MGHVKEKTKRKADRRPEQVPNHPKALWFGGIISVVAMVLMAGWFWVLTTNQGLILTAEQARSAEIQADEEAQAEALAAGDKTQADLDREAEESAAVKDEPAGKGDLPAAPEQSVVVTDTVELADYSILSVNGILNVGGDLVNVSSKPINGTVKTHVYTDGVAIGTAVTEVTGLAAGDKTKVNMVSDSDYQPGEKVLVVEFEPRK